MISFALLAPLALLLPMTADDHFAIRDGDTVAFLGGQHLSRAGVWKAH